MAHDTLWKNNDNDLDLNSVQLRGVTATTAWTVTAKVQNGASVVSGASAITCSPTTTAGNFRGTLSSTITLPAPGKRVKVVYTVVSTSGADGEFIKECIVRSRSV